MSEIGTDYVVGGVGSPRVIEVGDNLCTNPRLSDDTDGWESNSGDITISRVSDSGAYEEYMLKMSHSVSTFDYIRYTVDLGQSISGLDNKKILVALRIKHEAGGGEIIGDEEIPIKINLAIGGYLLGSKEIIINNDTKRIALLFEGNWSNASNDVELRIYTGVDFQPSGSIFLDDVYINKVSNDYNFDLSQENYLIFQQHLAGYHELMDGGGQQYDKKWRPNFTANWLIMTKQQEIYRQEIADAGELFVFPHSDFYWGFFALWTQDLERKHSFNRHIGHNSSLNLRGNEFLIDGITPGEIEYVEPPTLYTLIIGSVGVTTTVRMDLSPKDYYNQDDGDTEFIRTYDENTLVYLTAPATILDGGITKDFVEWQDENGAQITTARFVKITMGENKEYHAKYQFEETEAEGYGYGYGTSYGENL